MKMARVDVLVAVALCGALVACRRTSEPAGTSRPTDVWTGGGGITLRDWVTDPPTVEAEQGIRELRLVCAAPSVTERAPSGSASASDAPTNAGPKSKAPAA